MNARLISAGALATLVIGLTGLLLVDRSRDGTAASDAAPSVATAVAAPVTAPIAAPVTAGSTPPTSVSSSAPAAPDTTGPASGLPDRGLHPPLRDIDGWLQSDVSSLEELRGQVVAVQFWTFACRNCTATLPHMQELYRTYRDQGFEIVGVHAPEFEFEEDVDNIVEAAGELGVTWPIALDTAKQTFHSWQEGTRAFWPRIYLLDRNGHIRYDHIGEGRYDEIDAAVAALLAEPA